ncbi:MAG: NAD(P)/FAD-dependent oxidoreductase [Actinomycetota bacterium]
MGPAGSVAALVLARDGARVALLDKARYPRDKACGDLVGPRWVQVLADLCIEAPGAERIGDMIVIGPTGRSAKLPCYPGRTYPNHVMAMPRVRFDAILHEAALDAGAEYFAGRAVEAISIDVADDGIRLTGGQRLRADVVIGADGATSRVAEAAGLVDPDRVLWGFAVSAYVDDPIRQAAANRCGHPRRHDPRRPHRRPRSGGWVTAPRCRAPTSRSSCSSVRRWAAGRRRTRGPDARRSARR